MQLWMKGRRVLWGGMLWAIMDCDRDNILTLMRAIIPMDKYDSARVHISEVDFGERGAR